MDGSQGQAGQPMVASQQQQHSNLIRTDQVQKLPHLNDQQKAQHTQLVRGLWELLNTRDPSSHEYQTAHMKLTQLSQNLMKGMRLFQQSRQQALQQQQQQQQAQQQQAQGVQGQPVQRTQPNNPQNLGQLLPAIQAKVNQLNFFLPPNTTPEQLQNWVPEARLRYGIALQKQEVGRARLADLRQQFNQRQSQGNMTQEDMQAFKNRQLAAEKLLREGSEFLEKFMEQQESFKMQQQNQQGMNQSGGQAVMPPASSTQQPTVAPTSAAAPAATQAVASNQGTTGGMQAPTPAAHTINSAVNAARNQAGQQTAMSPSASQSGQAPSATAGATPTSTTQPSQQPGQRQQASSQQGTPGSQAMSTQGSASAHPQGYLANRSTEATARNINMVIPKSLNVSTPEPVAMPSSRPSLSGGPSHGAMGMMGQPAIQKHPGYVLEGEGQRVLSKKMLDILVRQVTGGGEGEMLTPDAEDFILQMADDFVDDVITQACRLAKLRPSSTLELRDIQLVLERNYNMRISGFSSDDLRTVKKPQPTQGWTQKMSAIQAAKVTQGKTE
ncbi:hypothetical protein N7474_005361 [Penicillium riverlandense]|uniref:uncharacterized protein n=1 Tax=Penicillium riverlandense TaxID=1903569 RepID=UPI002547F0AC|nr:uncharacterized protein N7474_005361 [Penicillium riverlandense]KAJ5819770.1 hypothetical protein N7474_005361 [Penicillium riverlandense]